MSPIYLDNAATTCVREDVANKMADILKSTYGNPSSTHSVGRSSKTILEQCRKRIASHFNVKSSEIVFTSGGTEADNLVLRSAVCDLGVKHIISSKIEHHAVGHTIEALQSSSQIKVSYVHLTEKGEVDVKHLEELLKNSSEKTLVSLMHINNEIGTILDLKLVAELCKTYNALFHSDTVQSVGHYHLDLQKIPIDFLAASAHKFHGPKGVGLLWIDDKEKIKPIITGGEQEDHFRAGTENIIGIYGMSLALKKSLTLIKNGKDKEVAELTKYLRTQLKNELGSMVKFNGPEESERRLYNTINLCLVDMNSRMLLRKLDKKGIYINVASACQKTAKSHVMEAIGISDKLSQGSVRISLGLQNTKKDVEIFLREFIKLVKEKKFQKKYVLK